MAVIQNVNEAPSFFATQSQSDVSDDLITSQVDPTQPQVNGLSSYTDPLVVDHTVKSRLPNFDPTLYNLDPSSHLMHFLGALLGVAGVGGLRRQQTINRMSGTMAGAHFLDLDGFWGALFGAYRMSDEQIPEVDGAILDPAVSVADPETWDAARSRDGKMRSRIVQLAAGFAQGATYSGVRMAAEAVLGSEVDVSESWMIVDTLPPGHASTVQPNTYFAVQSQYHTYDEMKGNRWSALQGGYVVPGNTPLGNRGEVVITPKRAISDEERIQVAHVLQDLAPAGVVITVLATPAVAHREVLPRFVYADSSDWSVTSVIASYQNVEDFGDVIYPSVDGANAASRPALSQYSGERWNYNSRVAAVTAYQMVNNAQSSTAVDAQTILYADGTAHEYAPTLAMLDPKQGALIRTGTEGVLTSYPYAAGRFG